MGGVAAGLGDISDLEIIADLGLALLLSTLIGVERELHAKSAGLRTHTLVGTGAALFMLVSKFGFTEVLTPDQVVLDPSRVAAQIVTGIGFIGGGLIFVRRDVVRGLTTAATVWLVAAIGMACGAGLVLLAIVATGAHFVIVVGYTPAQRVIARATRGPRLIRLSYYDGRGVLGGALERSTSSGFAVLRVRVEREDTDERGARVAVVTLRVQGKGSMTELVNEICQLPGVIQASSDVDEPIE